LYLNVPTAWSGLLSFCGNVAQALALLQLVQGRAERDPDSSDIDHKTLQKSLKYTRGIRKLYRHIHQNHEVALPGSIDPA